MLVDMFLLDAGCSSHMQLSHAAIVAPSHQEEALSCLSSQYQVWLVCVNVTDRMFVQSPSKFSLHLTGALYQMATCDKSQLTFHVTKLAA